MKRGTLIFVIIFIVVIGIIFGVWWFFATQNGIVPTEALRDFLPFGKNESSRDITPPTPTFTEPGDNGDIGSLPVLRELYDRPVSGALAFGSTTTTSIRFVERETGHVFEIGAEEISPRRLTNTTIPRVQEALFASEEKVLIRYLGEDGEALQTFVAKINEGTPGDGVGNLSGIFISPNADSIAVTDTDIFYTIAAEGSGYISKIDGESTKSVLPVTFTEWLSEWVGDTHIALTTKPSAGALGAYYLLDIEKGSLERLLGDRIGFTTLTGPSSAMVLFSEGERRSFSLHVLESSTNQTRPLSLRTLPEKCAWSPVSEEIVYCGVPESIPTGDYPDSWYKGQNSFTDSIWKLNIIDGQTELLVSPSEIARTDIDLINPMVSPFGTHLIFMNKKDGTLWSLRLPQQEIVEENELIDEE